MPNYHNGKIYRLVCNKTGLQYIGSTTKPLYERKACHNTDYKRWKDGKCNSFTTSYNIIQHNDYNIFLVEAYPCNTKEELLARERYWIENTNECVNISIPTRTNKEWRNDNREKIIIQRQKDKQKANMKHICACGKVYTQKHKSRHEKTKKHQSYINKGNDGKDS